MDFTRKNYSWSLDGLTRCIRDNHLESEIVAYTDMAAIVHVKSYYDSQILGAESSWCICQHMESWAQYVSRENRIQLFFYNFAPKCKVKENTDLVGATFIPGHNRPMLYCCFGKNNHPIHEYYKRQTPEIDDIDALDSILRTNFKCNIIEADGDFSLLLKEIEKNMSKKKGIEKSMPKKKDIKIDFEPLYEKKWPEDYSYFYTPFYSCEDSYDMPW